MTKPRGPYNVPRKDYETKLEALRLRSLDRYHMDTYGRVLTTPEEIMKFANDPYARARAEGYRSGLEVLVAGQLSGAGVEVQYEMFSMRYTIPERLAKYSPDFILPNGIIIETKGRFVTEDRKKHKLIKEQFPMLDIRIVFSNPSSKIGKKSKTTYAMWCDRLGILYSKRLIPLEWIKEPPNLERIQAAEKILGWRP